MSQTGESIVLAVQEVQQLPICVLVVRGGRGHVRSARRLERSRDLRDLSRGCGTRPAYAMTDGRRELELAEAARAERRFPERAEHLRKRGARARGGSRPRVAVRAPRARAARAPRPEARRELTGGARAPPRRSRPRRAGHPRPRPTR
jgi:hypothetical protein